MATYAFKRVSKAAEELPSEILQELLYVEVVGVSRGLQDSWTDDMIRRKLIGVVEDRLAVQYEKKLI